MSRDMVYEDVPRVSRRIGDTVVAGTNNSTIILGRDRLGGVDTGYGSAMGPGQGKAAGAMHLVVGRTGEDPDLDTDAASVYLSQRTDPDAAAVTEGVGPSTQRDRSAVVFRGDCIRGSARTDIKLSVGRAYILMSSDGRIVVEGDISLGELAAESILKGQSFAAWAAGHFHTSAQPGQPTSPALPSIPSGVFNPRVKC